MLAVSAATASAADGWQELKGAGFKVALPGNAQHSSKEFKTAVGTLKLHMYQVASQGQFFGVMHNVYPQRAVNAQGANKVLNGARDGAVRKVGGTLLSDTQIKLGQYPGRSFRVVATKNGVKMYMSWRVYLVNNRLYQLGVVSPYRPANAKDVKRFFDSFELSNRNVLDLIR